MGPLDGLRVIDAGTLAAAPLVATYLGELGADVIKVEQPAGGDHLRRWGAQKDGVGLYWKSVGRGKRSVTLDLRSPRGQELFLELAKRSDAVLENFRPGTLERWNIGWETLHAANPDLVLLRISGFGQTGPYASKPGFGTLVEAMSGFAHVTGEPGGPPTLPPFPLADAVAGLAGTYAVLAALYHRDAKSGGGQFIDLALLEPLMRMLEPIFLEYDQLGNNRERRGNRMPEVVPRNAYRCSDGRWLAISASAPTIALRVFRAIGRPELADDPAYADPQSRLEHSDEIDALVADWAAGQTRDEAIALLEREEVAVAPVHDVASLFEDAHVVARGVFERVSDEELGEVRVQSVAPRFSETPGEVGPLAPRLGAHNEEVYVGLLGLSEAELADLRAEGIV